MVPTLSVDRLRVSFSHRRGSIEAVDRAMRGEGSPSPIYEGEEALIAVMLGGFELFRGFEQLCVANDICHAKTR